MKRLLICFLVLNSMALIGQDQAKEDLNFRYGFYSLGIGPSTIGGFSWTNELGYTHRKSTFSFHFDTHLQFFEKVNNHRMHDFFINIALTYGRGMVKKDFYYELNVGPVFYSYFDERLTTSKGWFGSTTAGYRYKEYTGFGFKGQFDFGKKIVKKTSIDYSAFLIANTNLPILGVTAKLNLRSNLKRLDSK